MLTPRERLELAEDSVVLLTIEVLPNGESEPGEVEPLGGSDDSELIIDMEDLRALKTSLDDEDVEKYLRLWDAPRYEQDGAERKR